MRTTSGLLSIIGLFLSTTTTANAQVPQCTVPNTLVNGQVADATDVMENFNAIANCVDIATDEVVSHEGTPAAGEIAVFATSTGITGGNLSGDVTTSGGTATQLAPSGVAPGTYYNATVTVDAKGRVISAENGALGGGAGGATWSAITEWTHAANGNVTQVTAPKGSATRLLVQIQQVTASSAGQRIIEFSVDGGTTFFSTAGDYKHIPISGIEADTSAIFTQNSSSTAARSSLTTIEFLPDGPYIFSHNRGESYRFAGSQLPVTHIRVRNSVSSNLTGGVIKIFGQ